MAAVTDLQLDVGGRSLHVVRSGHGSPAVILEAGAGCWSEHWRAVQELTGDFTATYSYDRAGHGSSEPGGPWSLDGWLADLEAWLSAGQVPPPYLLVGHSLGGHIVRGFAARHLADVVGLILVDARSEDFFPQLPEAFLTRVAELFPDDTQLVIRADEIVRGLPGLADLPLSVIARGRADRIPSVFGLEQADRDLVELAWQRCQRDLAARSSQSRFLVASASGHMIPTEQPDLVASEIRSMIMLSRRPDKTVA
jgi:pimeloyl-ACP methyl ester carboxylesterase